MDPFLSIIIPAYNEERRLPGSLAEIRKFISLQSFTTEVIVVENGSTDSTFEIAQAFCDSQPDFRVIHENRKGKGLAVRRGMLEAIGKYRFMCDVDLSMPINELARFLPPVLNNFDIAIGSREAPGAVRYAEPIYRHLGGRAVNTLIRLLALPGLHDTQCGFKCFRDEIAEDLFHCQTLAGWSFDVEILYIARLRKYSIVEVPISWYYQSESKVHAVRDAIKMVLDLFLIRKNAWAGKYQKPARIAGR